ncbi:MAG: 2Fe-2S iron-sulfur cluster-binding protein [Chloroflexota bacterium]
MRLVIDGKPISFDEDDNLLVALLKADEHPTGGGCLCMGGDCFHCLATVDGVSYVRTCQVPAKPGMVIDRHPQDGYPQLPLDDTTTVEIHAHNKFCDVVVIGTGESGTAEIVKARSAGKSVISLDTKDGQEAVGIYDGPLVIARTAEGMWHINVKDEIVIATGAAEIHPVAPGSHLNGVMTSRAATQLAQAGVSLGKVVAIGSPPENIEVEQLSGDIIRFEGSTKVEAVVLEDDNGDEKRIACDSVAVGLGFHPRNALYRMGHGLPVRVVGEAALESDIPKCPAAGIVCPCSHVSVDDLNYTWDSGFQEMELVKRSTLAGTGTCQGSVCLPYLRSFLLEKGKELQPSFTARPVTKQLTMGEIAAGAHHHPTMRTALDAEHRALGAQMERSGGWWRPWTYGNKAEEYWAVREGVSIMDVSTLGKMIIQGPDVLPLLERLYPTQVATIKDGRSRYVLLLNERGYIMDDGLICKDSDNQYYLTFTSGGSSHSEMWVRDWAAGWGYNIRMLNVTSTFGAINLTGPLSNKVLEKAGVTEPPKFIRHKMVNIAGVDCRILRLSFTGELSYELHYPVEDSVKLWRALMTIGQEFGIKPHGLETLLTLRLEKGHIIVGQDTDFDTTARRAHHDWMVNLKKEEKFIGRHSVIRTNRIELDKMLVGFEMDGEPPIEGAVVWYKDEYAGYITSTGTSYVLGKAVMMGWLYYFDGELPENVVIDDRPAKRVPTPFYDKEATRARAK